jgi:RNA polymerase sigma factor (sigma-70 family)
LARWGLDKPIGDFKERNGMSGVEKDIPKASKKNGTQVRQRVGLAAEVFGKYGDEILAVIRFNVNDQSKANDIFQDFFVSLVRKPVPSHIEDIRGYLYKAITNDVIDFSRRTKNRQNNALKYAYIHKHDISQENPQDVVIHAEETERMFRLIENHLPKREATVLLKRCSEGFSTADTAKKLHLTKRTVSRYFSVAIKKIRRFIPKTDRVLK